MSDLSNVLVIMVMVSILIGLFLFLEWVKKKGEQRSQKIVDQFR